MWGHSPLGSTTITRHVICVCRYGDKAPKSFLARLVASVWMVSGIILLTMFTAQISARLVTQELNRGNHLFGKKVNAQLMW